MHAQVIPAEEAPSLGGAAALGDGYALVWRVCESERQQCLELEELLTAAEVARGRMRIFLGEQIVDVKCLVGASAVVLIVCTLTSVHLAYVELAEDQRARQSYDGDDGQELGRELSGEVVGKWRQDVVPEDAQAAGQRVDAERA